jgi:hypothetical protein
MPLHAASMQAECMHGSAAGAKWRSCGALLRGDPGRTSLHAGDAEAVHRFECGLGARHGAMRGECMAQAASQRGLLQDLDTPLWGHHSWRRLADTVARATMNKSGASKQDIDLTFGWREAMYSQIMQYHYETRFNRERRYRVTMFM